MAKTNDPHAAAIKSWQTRARNAGGGGVVQQRNDWIDPERTDQLLGVWGGGSGAAYRNGRDPATAAGREMTRAIKTLPVWSGKLFRGMNMKTTDLDALSVGKVFTIRKHSSATKGRGVALGFMTPRAGRRQVLLTIEDGRGRDYKRKGYTQDREVILMAGTKLMITSMKREVGGEPAEDVFHITAREVRD